MIISEITGKRGRPKKIELTIRDNVVPDCFSTGGKKFRALSITEEEKVFVNAHPELNIIADPE